MRRRKPSELGESWPKPEPEPSSPLSDTDKAAAAAGDLLQLATMPPPSAISISTPSLPSNHPSHPVVPRARSSNQLPSRARDVKPYQRPGPSKSRSRDKGVVDKDCWLPGGYWWKDGQTSMPPGRQPGELAGWAPLAGERAQQMRQEQKKTLHQHEQHVQGIESRDDAVAYLQQLKQGSVDRPRDGRQTITSTVDDSAIERSSAWKQLASWGGFRRHYKAEETHGATVDESMCVDAAPAAAPARTHHIVAPRAVLPSSAPATATPSATQMSADLVQAQLEAKRREVEEARKRLDHLLQAQQQLERLLLPDN